MLVGRPVTLTAAPVEIYCTFWTHQTVITENSWFQVTAFKRLCTNTEKLLLHAEILQLQVVFKTDFLLSPPNIDFLHMTMSPALTQTIINGEF